MSQPCEECHWIRDEGRKNKTKRTEPNCTKDVSFVMPYLTRNVLNWPLCHYYLHTFVLSYSPTSIVSRRRRHRRPLLFFLCMVGLNRLVATKLVAGLDFTGFRVNKIFHTVFNSKDITNFPLHLVHLYYHRVVAFVLFFLMSIYALYFQIVELFLIFVFAEF